MADFYCGSCGKVKDISLKRQRPSGKTPICAACAEKAKKRETNGRRMKSQYEYAKRKYLAGEMWFPD